MKAVQLLAYGDAVEGLALRDIEEPPVPGLGEALVQVRFAPLKLNDLMVAWASKMPSPMRSGVARSCWRSETQAERKGVRGPALKHCFICGLISRPCLNQSK